MLSMRENRKCNLHLHILLFSCFSFHFVPISFPNLFSWCDRYYDIVRDVRQNKGSILKASVDYIRKLKVDQQKKRLLEERVRLQETQNRKLVVKLQVSDITTLLQV